MTTPILVFDLDGVILRTTMIKHTAMLSLFGEHKQADLISKHILAQGGVPRRQKLRDLMRQFLDSEPTEAKLDEVLQLYAERLEQSLADAPLVEGIATFLRLHTGEAYVCSSAPYEEVLRQLRKNDLHTYFRALYCGDTPKPLALRQIKKSHFQQPIVFFGDAVADLNAAHDARVAFVGVVAEQNAFTSLCVPTVSSFVSSEQVWVNVEQAIKIAHQPSA